MSRKRKKNKGNPAGGSNPSNGLYDHPSVAAARGRKDADTPGGVPEASKPRRIDTFLLLIMILSSMSLILPSTLFLWAYAGTLIFGALGALFLGRKLREPWDINRAARFSLGFGMLVTATATIAVTVAWLSTL